MMGPEAMADRVATPAKMIQKLDQKSKDMSRIISTPPSYEGPHMAATYYF